MNNRLTIFVSLILVAGVCHAQSQTDKDAVLSVFDSWDLGWEQRDAELAVSEYADNADWTNAFGDRFQGKAALLDGLRHIFSLDFVMTGASASNEYADVSFLTPEVAMVRSKLVRTGQQMSNGQVMPDRHINHLRVLEKHNGRWVIVSHLISQAKPKR